MILDAHHHFWTYSAPEFGWIPDEWSVIRRSFLPDDLEKTCRDAGVDGVVSVQARQSEEETRWLLDMAAKHALVRGVVGWLPLIADDVSSRLDQLAAHPARSRLCGLRHVLQAEADDAYMLREDFNRGVRMLTRRGLAYDILVFERHLPNAIQFVDRHPDQTFIVDHIAKPRIAAGELEPWAANLRELARRPNVACKLSGMVTEDDVRSWTPARLRPYFETAIGAFGPDRLLFGSDWPVCLAGVSYSEWKHLVESAISGFSAPERAAIMGGNTARLYKLSPA